MKVAVGFKDMPRGFKSWFIRLKSRPEIVRKEFPDADAIGFEIDSLRNEVYIEMLDKFPNIRHHIIDDEKGTVMTIPE